MLGVSLLNLATFWRIRQLAGVLLIPYVAWLCLATALNYEIVRRNPNAESLVVPAAGAQIQLRR